MALPANATLRSYAIAFLLIVVSAHHSIVGLKLAIANYKDRQSRDVVSRFEKRFEPARTALLDRGTKAAGYITDLPEDEHWLDDYYRVQYSLAPVLITTDPDSSFFVTNFHSPTSADRLVSRELVPIADYGRGVLLLSKRTR